MRRMSAAVKRVPRGLRARGRAAVGALVRPPARAGPSRRGAASPTTARVIVAPRHEPRRRRRDRDAGAVTRLGLRRLSRVPGGDRPPATGPRQAAPRAMDSWVAARGAAARDDGTPPSGRPPPAGARARPGGASTGVTGHEGRVRPVPRRLCPDRGEIVAPGTVRPRRGGDVARAVAHARPGGVPARRDHRAAWSDTASGRDVRAHPPGRRRYSTIAWCTNALISRR